MKGTMDVKKKEEKRNCYAEFRHTINVLRRLHNYVACKTNGHSQDRLRPNNSLFLYRRVKTIGFQLQFQKLPVWAAQWQHVEKIDKELKQSSSPQFLPTHLI